MEKNNEILMQFGDFLRVERAKKKMSQEEFAEFLGLSSLNHYGKIERGKTNIKLTTAFAILNALDIKFEDLYKKK